MTPELKAFRARLRRVLAEYVRTEGCGCCGSYEEHRAAAEQLGALVGVRKYSDGSGRDFSRYEPKRKAGRR